MDPEPHRPDRERRHAGRLGPGQLDLLGLFWGLSGDDFTDEGENAGDVAYAARVLGPGLWEEPSYRSSEECVTLQLLRSLSCRTDGGVP